MARGRFVEEGLGSQRALEERIAAVLAEASALSVKDLVIGGQDVMQALQISPGKVVGQVLAKLLDAVLDDPKLNTREDLLARVPDLARQLSTGNPQGGSPDGSSR